MPKWVNLARDNSSSAESMLSIRGLVNPTWPVLTKGDRPFILLLTGLCSSRISMLYHRAIRDAWRLWFCSLEDDVDDDDDVVLIVIAMTFIIIVVTVIVIIITWHHFHDVIFLIVIIATVMTSSSWSSSSSWHHPHDHHRHHDIIHMIVIVIMTSSSWSSSSSSLSPVSRYNYELLSSLYPLALRKGTLFKCLVYLALEH